MLPYVCGISNCRRYFANVHSLQWNLQCFSLSIFQAIATLLTLGEVINLFMSYTEHSKILAMISLVLWFYKCHIIN